MGKLPGTFYDGLVSGSFYHRPPLSGGFNRGETGGALTLAGKFIYK
jgi:hypothetical protein